MPQEYLTGKIDLNSSIDSLPFVQSRLSEVENLMVSQADGYNPDLQSALRLLISTGGKRIRPTLILLIGDMLNADLQGTITLAAAIELLHTATLVHDDLIDGALLRRGAPTLNSRWSPAATVLTGDFLFSCSAYLVSLTDSIDIVRIFSKTLTTIVNGEINQLFGGRCNLSHSDYFRRIYAKTASLFETSTLTAALLSHAEPKMEQALKMFGYNLGMAFQIVDDVLDYSGSIESVGKPVGSDLRQGLITAPILFYLESHPSDPDFAPFMDGKCVDDEERLETIIHKIAASNAIDQSLEEAHHFSNLARESLSILPESLHKDALMDMASYIVERNV